MCILARFWWWLSGGVVAAAQERRRGEIVCENGKSEMRVKYVGGGGVLKGLWELQKRWLCF